MLLIAEVFLYNKFKIMKTVLKSINDYSVLKKGELTTIAGVPSRKKSNFGYQLLSKAESYMVIDTKTGKTTLIKKY